jgi:hypothetical protein
METLTPVEARKVLTDAQASVVLGCSLARSESRSWFTTQLAL